MVKTRSIGAIVSLIAALLVICLAYGLDKWKESANLIHARTFEQTWFYFQLIIINVIFVISLITLNWFINSKLRPNVIASLTIFIVGALLTIYPFLFMIAVQNPRFAESLPHGIYQLFPVTLLSIACAFITAIGGIGLFRKTKD
jgi:hypothetical protein